LELVEESLKSVLPSKLSLKNPDIWVEENEINVNMRMEEILMQKLREEVAKAKLRCRSSHEPNRMQMRKILCSP